VAFFKSAEGEHQADFIKIVVWRKQAENTANFLKKRSLAGIEGRIQTGSYEGQDGKRVYITEVVADSVQFLEPRGAQDSSNGQSNTNLNRNSKMHHRDNMDRIHNRKHERMMILLLIMVGR
jgi:single-strand DNA-binding protein